MKKKRPEKNILELATFVLVITALSFVLCASLVSALKKDIEYPEQWVTISEKSLKRER